MGQKAASAVGQVHAPARSLEQFRAKGRLQLGDADRQRRLRDIHPGGGLGEIAGLDHGQEIADLIAVHYRNYLWVCPITFNLYHLIDRDRVTPTNMESDVRSDEHTSELQSLMRIQYAVLRLKKKKLKNKTPFT